MDMNLILTFNEYVLRVALGTVHLAGRGGVAMVFRGKLFSVSMHILSKKISVSDMGIKQIPLCLKAKALT